MQVGDKVRCKSGNIQNNIGEGAIGYVHGFARFSRYHAREVFVSDVPDRAGPPRQPWCGWFWLNDVELVEPHAHESVVTSDGHGAYCAHCGDCLA